MVSGRDEVAVPLFTRELLAMRLAQPSVSTPESLHKPGARVVSAAVLVPLVPRKSGLSVLLTHRADHLRGHPAQVSFPGGRTEPNDDDAIATALRETEEEIGIARSHIDILGRLPDYETPSSFRISSVVGWLEPPFDIKPNPFEVAEAFELPLSFILDRTNYRRRSYTYDGRNRNYLAIPYEGRYIWGRPPVFFTFYILS